jgi:hypothetical protein
MRPWLVVPIALVAFAPLGAGGCGTDAIGVGDCKQIEEARCRAAAKCPAIPLGNVYYTSGNAVDACIRFYDVACLHGLEVNDPGAPAVAACVAAIEATDGGASCSVVEEPWTDPKGRCTWLNPSNIPEASTPEASPDASDAPSDGSDGATSNGDGGD